MLDRIAASDKVSQVGFLTLGETTRSGYPGEGWVSSIGRKARPGAGRIARASPDCHRLSPAH